MVMELGWMTACFTGPHTPPPSSEAQATEAQTRADRVACVAPAACLTAKCQEATGCPSGPVRLATCPCWCPGLAVWWLCGLPWYPACCRAPTHVDVYNYKLRQDADALASGTAFTVYASVSTDGRVLNFGVQPVYPPFKPVEGPPPPPYAPQAVSP